jgi:hypothetical protein
MQGKYSGGAKSKIPQVKIPPLSNCDWLSSGFKLYREKKTAAHFFYRT